MSTDKPWERPWSMDEIIENSDKWNLAGDVALLNTLKSFSENLLKRTTEINNSVHHLTKNLDETSLKLSIAENEFRNLRNNQFIESRVYEDDESLPQTEEVKSQTEEKNDHTEEIRAAALKGLEVLEEYFEKIEVEVSDSEDEDIDLPFVLRPKDLYMDRPLPYVIGSDEWHKNWHVGLEDSSSDSETEKVSDKFSESDSESDLPIIQDRPQIKGSDSSSELDFSQKNDRKIKTDLHSSDSENSVPAQGGPISGNLFAEQLAAKLGHVITQYEEPEINRRSIKPSKPHYGDIFFDEPPPLDEPKGMFSGGSGLFDDEDEDIPYSTPKNSKVETPKSRGLFEDSDEDIFMKKDAQKEIKAPLFGEQPPNIDEIKKPVGGVSIFGGGNLFDKKLLKRQVSSDTEDEEKEDQDKKKVDLFSEDLFKPSSEKINTVSGKSVKKVNLFDSDEEETKDLFEEEKKTVEESFKEEKPEERRNDKILFNEDETKISEEKPEKEISLFGDDDDFFKDDLFSSNSAKKLTSGLFENIPNDDLFEVKKEETKSSNIFDDLVGVNAKNSINSDTKIEKQNTFEENERIISEKVTPPLHKSRLFDFPPPDAADLFSAAVTPDDLFSEAKTPDDLFGETRASGLFDSSPVDMSTPQATPTPIPTMRLFDQSPPPDDEWDAKSDHVSENEDLEDFEESKNEKEADLFSEEPPSLESVRNKPGKLKLNLNINVGALMPGYVPPKRVDGAAKMNNDVRETSPVEASSGGEVKSRDTDKMSNDDVPVTSFDETDRIEVLHTVTKDRVKVPLRRRPSTRKGRKEALRHSISDFTLEQNEEKRIQEVKMKSEDKEKRIEERGLKYDEKEVKISKDDSLFDVTPEKEKFLNPLKKKEISLLDNLPKNEDLFATKVEEPKNEDLFGKSENVSFEENQKSSKHLEERKLFESPKSAKPRGLFDDDDEDNDNNLFTAKKPMQPTKPKKSLFDDDNDDDDIFKSFGAASVKKSGTKKNAEKKMAKGSSVKKLENTKPEDDPLSALLK